MSEKQRTSYEETARHNKKNYLKEMEAYKAMKAEEAETNRKEEEEHMKIQKQEVLQLLKKKENTLNIIKKIKEKNKKKNVDLNKHKKLASSFLLFGKAARKALQEECPGITYSMVNTMISVKLKELGEEEKGMWNVRTAEAMETYKKEMEEHNKSVIAATDGGAGGSSSNK